MIGQLAKSLEFFIKVEKKLVIILPEKSFEKKKKFDEFY